MSKPQKISCGIVGVGSLGQHHARIYAALDKTELVGLYDSDLDRAHEIASRYGGQVFGSIAELGAACDAVSVVVPTDYHCQVALELFEAGCALLIEKPLCLNLKEAEMILEGAKRAGTVVQVGHIEHFNPVMAYMENAVDLPRYITADRLAPFNIRGTEVGVVLDLMIHDIGVILALVKSPLVDCQSIGVRVLTRTEDIANARITFENGCVANINTSRVSQKKVREIRVFQSDAYLSLDFMNQEGHLVKRNGMNLEKEPIPIEKGEPLMLELSAFADCVARQSDPKVNAFLGKAALELAIKITEQIHAGKNF